MALTGNAFALAYSVRCLPSNKAPEAQIRLCRWFGAYSDDVDGRFQRDVDGHSGHVDKVGAQRRWDDNHARYLRD